METLQGTRQQPKALRIMDGFIWLCMALLVAVTVVVAVFWIGRGAIGGGAMYTQGWTGEVIIEHVQPSGATISADLSEPPDSEKVATYPRFLSANVQAEVQGTGPRIALVVEAIVDLAFAWFALITVQRLTRSSMRGEVFTKENASRIARLGWAALSYPFVALFIGRSIFNSVVTNEQVGVSGFWVREDFGSLWPWIGAGLLLHTVARAFDWGVELQELETATI